MTLTIDFSGDYTVFDGRESITLRSRTSPGQAGFTDYTLSDALRQPQSTASETINGSLDTVETCVWFVWTDVLTAAGMPLPPKVADATVTDSDGAVWVVTKVDEVPLLSGYDLACTKAVG